MNSPSTNLAWHYPSGASDLQTRRQQRPKQQTRAAFNPITNQYDPPAPQTSLRRQMRTNSSGSAPPGTSFPTQPSSSSNAMAGTSDAGLLLNLHSPYNTAQSNTGSSPAFPPNFTPNSDPNPTGFNDLTGSNWNYANLWNPVDFSQGPSSMQPFGDMMIESQDVDMSMLGLDMMPWFDNFSGGDMLFGGDGRQAGGGAGAPGAGTPQG